MLNRLLDERMQGSVIVSAFHSNNPDRIRALFSDAIKRRDVELVEMMLKQGTLGRYRGLLKVEEEDFAYAFERGYLEIVKILNQYYLSSQFAKYEIPYEKINYKSWGVNPNPPFGNEFEGGSLGWIFDATLEEERVAVKFISANIYGVYYCKPEFFVNRSYQKEFFTEVKATIELQSPYTVEFKGIVFHGAVPGMIMKRYDCSLRSYLAKCKKSKSTISLEQKLIWAKEICDAVAAIHKKGWLHNDLRAANIFLDEKRHAVVGDFGMARKISEKVKLTRSSARFFPPESVYDCKELVTSPQSDIYSLGLILWEMMTGELPFYGKQEMEIVLIKHAGVHEKISEDFPDIFKELIQDCWNDDPFKRPTPEALSQRIQVALDELYQAKLPEKPRFFTTPTSVTKEKTSSQIKMGIS